MVDFLLLAMVRLCVGATASGYLCGVMKAEGGWRVEMTEWSFVSWTSHYAVTVLLHALDFRTPVTWKNLSTPIEPAKDKKKRRIKEERLFRKSSEKEIMILL